MMVRRSLAVIDALHQQLFAALLGTAWSHGVGHHVTGRAAAG